MMKKKKVHSITENVLRITEYDLSGKRCIVFQEEDLKKQAEELERLRSEITGLIESMNDSRLYPQSLKRRHYSILPRSIIQGFIKRVSASTSQV